MCGIIGIIGKAPVTPLLVDALKRLEYRGYDSRRRRHPGERPHRPAPGRGQAGQPRGAAGGRAARRHDRHRPHPLGDPWRAHRAQRPSASRPTGSRWCTTASSRTSRSCRTSWTAEGRRFDSDTDTEVVAQLLDLVCSSGRCRPSRRWARRWSGCAAPSRWPSLFSGRHDLLIGARRGSSLAVGYGDGEMYVGSDALALAPFTKRVSYLEDGDWVVLSRRRRTGLRGQPRGEARDPPERPHRAR